MAFTAASPLKMDAARMASTAEELAQELLSWAVPAIAGDFTKEVDLVANSAIGLAYNAVDLAAYVDKMSTPEQNVTVFRRVQAAARRVHAMHLQVMDDLTR